MDELNINYGVSRGKQIINIVFSSYFAIFGLYILIREALISNYSVFFIGAAITVVLAAIMLLRNTVWLSPPLVKVNNTIFETNFPKQKKLETDWATVSNVNIGASYVVLFVNGGQKQRNIELSGLKYNDIKLVKSKVIEICEYKNIPYRND